jgi:hypothetical protein
METIFIIAAIFTGIYMIIKVFTDFLLKRKIIKSGHFQQAQILETPPVTREENQYPTLKWGLVALMAGAGLIVIEFLQRNGSIHWEEGPDSFLPFGIELVFISAGFLIYFLIVNAIKSRKR